MIQDTNLVTLVLVEDDDVDAMTIERSFKKNKIANPIKRAVDGMQALEMMRNNEIENPYIVLLDLQMPRLNGIEFLQAIRSDDALAKTVVFVLTTSEDDRDIENSYDFNIAGYYSKGNAGENFIDIVNVLDNYWKVVHLPHIDSE
jgi:DNA-binding NarL/FixJ family response regulator